MAFVLLSSLFYWAGLKCDVSLTNSLLRSSVETRRKKALLQIAAPSWTDRDLRCCSWDTLELLLMFLGVTAPSVPMTARIPVDFPPHPPPTAPPVPRVSPGSPVLYFPPCRYRSSMYHSSLSSPTMSAFTCLPLCIYCNTVDSIYSRF